MKEGYIVWNESNCKSEFFGVYRTWKKAFAQFRKIVRNKYGKCPRGSYEDIQDWLVGNEMEDGSDSLKITYFEEFESEKESE